MLHLVREKVSTYKELANLLGLERVGHHLPNNVLAHIYRTIEALEVEWDEQIPKINALVFRSDGTASPLVCGMLSGDTDMQPTVKQIAEHAASVANYENWDKVLAAFKPKL